MRGFVMLAVVGCWAVVGQDHDHHEPESFRDVVQRIVRSSRENLRPLKASRIEMHPRMDYWYEVTDVLPGARICRIYEHPEVVYKCEWQRDKNVSAIYSRVLENIAAALGSADWKALSSPKATRFQPVNPRRNGVVEVRITGSARDPVVEVLFFAVARE